MRTKLWMLAAGLCAGLGAARSARADTNTDATSVDERPRFNAASSVRNGLTLPILVAPGSVTASAATTVFWAGYDQARDSLTFRSHADLHVYGPLDARVGVTYLPNTMQNAMQPHAGLRVRLLTQENDGLDLGLGAFYRMERFTDDEGLMQGLLTAATHIGRLALLGNLSYGQDPEGDDREGDVGLAALYELSAALHVGVESRLRFDLGSQDPKRAARRDTSFDAIVAPTVGYSVGPVALLAQAGVSTMRAKSWRAGTIAMGGLAVAY
jgi:hypothetical protein